MNNYHDQSESEPSECPECNSSMTETNSITSTWLQCDECEYTVINGVEFLTEAQQYEADANADHITGGQFNGQV
jgi:DNA-directed RNA polymerase subunit M/transcription elongation factor TFIIS